MADYHVADIKTEITRKSIPAIHTWNRLEGRPRIHNFNKAMRAEVHDALWMITRQWQMGELQADDAGSPVSAKVHISTSEMTQYKAASHDLQAYEKNVPLEVKAEQKKIPFDRAGYKISLDIRLRMGQYWLKLLKRKSLNYESEYTVAYPFSMPANDRYKESVYAHQEVWKTMSAISGRCMDGYALYESIVAGHPASNGIEGADPNMTALNDLGVEFLNWYQKIFYQPSDVNNNAWLPDRLEYQFECVADTATESKSLTADEYYHGHLDWYAFNIERKEGVEAAQVKKTFTDSFIPAHVQFEGMPNTRWWKFEDSKTSFGDVKPAKTDFAKLLLIEFGLVFANDWFIVPHKLPVGSLANIEGLAVKNNFGETIWIEATEEEGNSLMEWSMFKMRSNIQDNTLLLAPTAIKVHEGEALEEIALIRDEVANMVWGIEQTIPLVTGMGDKGSEAALRVKQFHENKVNQNKMPDFVPPTAPIYYQAMTETPENWIPFIPVHIENDNREVQLQRSSMLRIIEGDTLAPAKIKPVTSILREGLDASVPSAYYIHEEEVPRMGVHVTQSFQRTRWMNGEVFVWLGMRKQAGKGEGSSWLAFDQIK